MDRPTPEGFLRDAAEDIGKARAMRAYHGEQEKEWASRIAHRIDYRDSILVWINGGAAGPRPTKPEGY